MPTESFVNIEKLLEPISAEQPAGPNVHNTEDADRYNAVSRIRLRYFPNAKGWQQKYRTSCLRGTPRPQPEESASWRAVAEHATTCLTGQSKDLWASAYLLVGLTYRHGFAGLHQGLSFLTELMKRYGAQLHPSEQPLSELRKALPDVEDALQFAPLTDAAHGARCHLDFVIASDISTFTPEQLEPYLALNTPLREQLQSELAESSAEHMRQLAADIQLCDAGLTALEQETRTQFPNLPNQNEYPNYDNIRKELKACQGIIEPFVKTESTAAPEGTSPEGGGATDQSLASGGVAQNRQKALRQLEEIAAFFERVEPLSPLPYVIRRAVAWGNMSLPQVLAELLSEDERNKLKERAGIPVHMENPPG